MMSINNLRDKLRVAAVLFAACVSTGCGAKDSAYVFELGEGAAHAPAAGTEVYEDSGREPGQERDAEVTTLIYVYVCGAVAEPGVVALPEGSRADDALRAAGGFTEDARTDYVNLAAKVMDGEKLYFPDCVEAQEWAAQERAEADGLVNINTADVARLCTLPGIGEARAQAVIDYREANGAFQSVEDIMKVPGIKSAAYEKLRDRITVN